VALEPDEKQLTFYQLRYVYPKYVAPVLFSWLEGLRREIGRFAHSHTSTDINIISTAGSIPSSSTYQDFVCPPTVMSTEDRVGVLEQEPLAHSATRKEFLFATDSGSSPTSAVSSGKRVYMV